MVDAGSTVWMHHQDSHEKHKEKTWWELHRNATSVEKQEGMIGPYFYNILIHLFLKGLINLRNDMTCVPNCGIWNSMYISRLLIILLLVGSRTFQRVILFFFLWRCPWCNCYRPRKWTRRHEFKSWTRLIAFHIALIPLGKVWIQLVSLQLWVNSRTD